jgi:hypothetical protein
VRAKRASAGGDIFYIVQFRVIFKGITLLKSAIKNKKSRKINLAPLLFRSLNRRIFCFLPNRPERAKNKNLI